MKSLALLVTMLLSMHTVACWADTPCAEALVKSTYASSSSVHTDWRLASLVTENDWKEATHNGSLNVPIYGVMAGGNYSDFKKRVHNMEVNFQQSLTTDQLYNVAWTGLSGTASNDYKTCLSNYISQLGLRLIVQYADQNYVYILAQYNPIGPSGPVSVQWVPNSIGGAAVSPTTIPAGGNGTIIRVRRPTYHSVPLFANYSNIHSEAAVITAPVPDPPQPKSDCIENVNFTGLAPGGVGTSSVTCSGMMPGAQADTTFTGGFILDGGGTWYQLAVSVNGAFSGPGQPGWFDENVPAPGKTDWPWKVTLPSVAVNPNGTVTVVFRCNRPEQANGHQTSCSAMPGSRLEVTTP